MSKHVLIVDDSRTESLKARLILEREGFRVSLATDGHEGLVKAAQDKPDLIVLDTLMPQMNGFEACGRLKLDPSTRHIPILMLPTAEEAAEMPSGANLPQFLIKPYDPRGLIGKVSELANGHAALNDQAELEQLRRQAANANQARSDFLANMSHELRTPLHEIMGMTELLYGTELNAEQQAYLETAKRSSNALLSLISDVIEFSELEAGQLELHPKDFDLADPIQRVIEIMGARAQDKGLRFSTGCAPQVPHALHGDGNRLRQILDNLVANAIKFTERGDISVRVDLASQVDRAVELHVRVTDTGIGIPADRHAVIFEPFQQADVSATRRYGGLGMGLAMARQLVKLMNGRLWVESEPGQGSTFHFTVKMMAVAQAAPATPARNWPRPLNILVAEDSPTNQLIARSSLKKAGHQVTIAVNGLEAVKADEQARAQHAPIDLILMDVSMPEMDGLDATRAIRVKEQTPGSGHIPIVAMTAFATKEYHDKCFESGMDGYVTKPVRIDELNKTLEPLLTETGDRESGIEDQGSGTEVAAPGPIDLTAALEVVGGDVDILREAVSLSLEEVAGELAALRAAVGTSNAKEVEARAHRLKGVMGALGGTLAHAAGQQLESMGEQGNLAQAPEALKRFEHELRRVVTFYEDPRWAQQAQQQAELMALAEAGGA
ncbi:MAG: response regulator [Chloroflexi bacterium]|nr:response regulator [Chloroflexota bacterium]